MDRLPFFGCCVLLFVLKEVAERVLIAPLDPGNFDSHVQAPLALILDAIAAPNHGAALTPWLISLPFFLAGCWLIVRRLNTLRWSRAWLALYFLPVISSTLLCVLALAQAPALNTERASSYWPYEDSTSLAFSSALAALAGLLGAVLLFLLNPPHGWVFVIGIPLVIGLLTTVLHSIRSKRSFLDCVRASMVSLVILGILTCALRPMGTAVLVGAVLALPIVLIGVSIGQLIVGNSFDAAQRSS
ncbi:hypothetical protein [Bryobacter aggregatus]|uniref:hypothetical protein n=1 Tax=Bryobacter aggregatus TaxID=360054 RepID=UPI0004E0CAFC|nr:hypothetical protein [Bryobacter aggregatus]